MTLAFRTHEILHRQTTGFVVVQHDLGPEVAAFAEACVHEFAGFLVSVLNVIGTASPFPVAIGRYAFNCFITGALEEES